jgi:hypothetical protein
MKASGEGGFYKKYEEPVKVDFLIKAKSFILQKKEKLNVSLRKQMALYFFKKRINIKIALQFKIVIWHIFEKMDRLKITMNEVMEGKIFPKKPLEKEGADSFFYYVKRGETKKIEEMLRKNRYLVYEFDHVRII